MTGVATEIVLGPFQVELIEGRLLRNGVNLALRPQAFRVLKLLIQNRGQLVTYERLIHEAWGVQVSKHTVSTTINEVKNALAECGSWIACRPKFGYALNMPSSAEKLRRGWHFWNQFTRSGFENALRCFEQAADLDGSDFRAFEAMGSIHLMSSAFLISPPCEMEAPFWECHRRAVSLSSPTAESRLDRAFALFLFERRFAEAEAELLALRAEWPSCVQVHIRLAQVYLASGRLEEARATTVSALTADELSPLLGFLAIVTRLFCREFDLAAEFGKATMDLHPGAHVARAFYAEALEFAGRLAEALPQYSAAAMMEPQARWIKANEARCLVKLGRSADAVAILDELQRNRCTQYVDAYHVALLLDALGHREHAIDELRRAYEEKSYAILFADVDAKADGLRGDPRFARLRSGIPKNTSTERQSVLADPVLEVR